MKIFNILTVVAACCFCIAVQALEDYTMPSGRVLRDAYIMERKPDGVVVAHSTGVMFVKYSQMPEKLRKELGYDPEECSEYEKKEQKQKAAAAKRRAAAKAEQAKRDKKIEERRAKYRITELEDKIKATELHIKRLKMEIPQLETESKTYLDDAVKLSSSSGSGTSGYCRNGFWSSGSIHSNQANRTSAKKRFKAASALGDEYSKTKFRLENYKDTLEREILELDKMKRQLKKLKAKQSSKSGGFLSNLF
ncbi:MAG: hypothetical protein PHV59_00860 [Victivallales bacterium]|nr:hypothetical protein [Victivallales bacterium]